MSTFLRSITMLFCVSILALTLGACSLSDTPEEIKAAELQAQLDENNELMETIGRLMVIPNEEPIIATINEAELLIKEQPFYAGVSNGDKLVIFPKSQKAVIYSPSKNIIVNSGPFTINNTPTAPPVK